MNSLKRFIKLLSPKYQKLILEYKTELKSRYGNGAPPHPELYNIINSKRDIYAELLKKFLAFKDTFTAIKKCGESNISETEPCWNNGYLPGLDIISLYGMIAEFKPKRYLEIGSGNSTKVAYKAIKDNKLNTFITSIDPYPRASIDQLANKVIRKPLENTDVSLAQELEANDILFIDNSHRVLPNSDVTVCFLEILPRLKKGVIVHIHDIYLPYDYPDFMIERFYSEQYMLAVHLLAGNKYEMLMPAFFVSEDKELASVLEPVWQHPDLSDVEKHGGSFWFRVV